MNFLGRFNAQRLMGLLVGKKLTSECENALNNQINMELHACQEYLSMAYHFDRCDVALPGIHKFFKESSDEERSHAEKIMQYINKRGGQIIISEIPAPTVCHATAKSAMEYALKLEIKVNDSLLAIHAQASKDNDPNLCDFIETHFLQEQVDAQKQLADYIRQMERTEKELGTFVFDLNLKGGMHKN